ncbi:S-adenosyl-L-methionine-dependent methyltransferase [Chiua virens]|nr:S-adenosyl-L-methionine-dependent methyltransferase [Chiua virens]
MSNIVHKPFSSLCDAIMNYNLPACMRLVEHLHIAEILREADENRQHGHVDDQDSRVPSSCAKVEPDPGEGPPAKTLADFKHGPRAHKNTEGLHVVDITNVICLYAGTNYVDPSDLVHALRLLSTHHIFRETAPDTFSLNRVASLLDTGKSVDAVFTNPESKYDDTGETAAFVALMTDELFKAAAYLTEAFTDVQLPTRTPSANKLFPADPMLSGTTIPPSTSIHCRESCVYPEEDQNPQPASGTLPSTESLEKVISPSFPEDILISPQTHATQIHIPPCRDPVKSSTQAEKECSPSGGVAKHEKLSAFSLAFHTDAPYFDWLENGGEDPLGGTGQGAGACIQTRMQSDMQAMQSAASRKAHNAVSRKPFRLKRFSRAMTGTTGWEVPKAILSGFDWYSLPTGSTIVDVGGGIGSTTMILARALNDPRADSSLTGTTSDEQRDTITAKDDVNLRFIVQDKPVVTALGIEAWHSKFPEMLESGEVVFQDQDFFEPQSASEPHPAVYLLRVVLHDWPDELARRILINLRVASDHETRLVIAEHVLPLACVDEDVLDHMNIEASRTDEWTLNSVLARVEGAERTLVPPPLLSNLGKASATAYWMDLTMHISLNGKERTLREFCALALSAGWRVAHMTRPDGSLFAYLVCEPIALPDDAQAIYNAIVPI